MAERWTFWLNLVACAALSVSAIEIVRTSGSRIVLALVLVSIAVLVVTLFRRRADSGVRVRTDHQQP